MIETASDVVRRVGYCKYYPQGHREAAFSIAHDDFRPSDVLSKMNAANEGVICAVIVETARGVENAEEILVVPGLDLVWVGYVDLSLSMGITGQFSHPEFVKAVSHVLKAWEPLHVPVAIMVSDPRQGLERLRQGFRCWSYWGISGCPNERSPKEFDQFGRANRTVLPQLKMECPAVRVATTERTHEPLSSGVISEG